jgi:hypothetical protein
MFAFCKNVTHKSYTFPNVCFTCRHLPVIRKPLLTFTSCHFGPHLYAARLLTALENYLQKQNFSIPNIL